ncbi:MAG: PAS domain-containing protein, partial [Planctomycetaceae bacterium]|nr:PAS domain-containing protein [Planctomycetaceae bacterium]
MLCWCVTVPLSFYLFAAFMSQAEKLFTHLLENSPLIIAVFDKKGRAVLCSNAFLRFVQAKTMEEITGFPFAEIYRRLSDEKLTAESLQIFKNIQESCSPRIEYRRATLYNAEAGGYHSFTIETTPILDENGQFDGVGVCFYDAAGDVPQEFEKVALMLFDATPMLCSFWGADGKMLHCNLEALRLLGIEKRSDYAERFYDLNPEFQPDGESTVDKVKRYIADTFEYGTQRFE